MLTPRVDGSRMMEDRVQGKSIFGQAVVFGVVVVCVFCSVAFGQPWDGNGVEGDPYQIWDACDMQAIGADSNYWGAHFKLCADLNLGAYTGTSFNIVGNFTGVFDGNGHTISSFTYTSTGVHNIGLFSDVNDVNAEVRNLKLTDPSLDAGDVFNVGALAGRFYYGRITGCSIKGGRVQGGTHVGGLVGYCRGDIYGCDSTASVTGVHDSIGGLVGKTVEANILECWTSGNVSGGYRVGGLVGYSVEPAWVERSTIARCYSRGSSSGTVQVGGIAGDNGGKITECYSACGVLGNEEVGGLVGFDRSPHSSYTNCFWDVNVNPDVNGIGYGSDPNVIGKSTAEMQMEATYTDAGWDFVGEVINGANDIWDICEGTNYPKFVWQIPVGDLVCPDGVNFDDYAYFAEHWYETDYGDVNGVELTGDGKVNWDDFGMFAGWWMVSSCGGCGGADFTGEGDVDYMDLDVLAGYWLESEYGDCGGAELTGDGMVGVDDLGEFTENWLAGL